MKISVLISYLLSYLLITFGQAMLVETITMHKRKVSVKALVVAYVASYLFKAAVYLFMPADTPGAIYINMICTAAPLMAISLFLYRGTLITCIFAGASTMIGVLGESAAVYIVCLVSGTEANELMNNPSLISIGIITSGVLTTAILFIAAFICRQFQKNSSRIENSYLTAILLTITSTLVVTYNIMHNVMSDNPLDEITALLIAIALVGINFLVLFLYRRIIADTENRYRNLFADTPAGVCVLKSDKRLSIVLANKTFYHIMGITPKQTKKRRAKAEESFLELLDDESREQVCRQWEEIRNSSGGGRDFSYELPITLPSGDKRSILASIFYNRDGSGNISVNVIDITDRKRMEDELRISEERYRLALSQSGKVLFFFDVPSRTIRLSKELAQAFGIPLEVDNMPENSITNNLIEPKSVENYKSFYEKIIAGDPSGTTIIACHTSNAPDTVLWYQLAFTSVFDANGVPQSAVITYEDLQQQRKQEIAGAWKQMNLLSVPESEYVIAEYDLTQNRILSQVGRLFSKLPEFVTGYDEINAFVLEHFIYEEDEVSYRQFLDRKRLMTMFENGKSEDHTEYRSLQSGSDPRWTTTSIQMIRDPYSGNILAQLLFRDIDDEKSEQLGILQNVEELKKELESSRIKIMINQMQPHFLYNALSAIQTIVKTDPDYAYSLIHDFTIHLRSSIKALQSDAPIPFLDELKNIRAYLNIEQMRFGDSLKVNYEIDCDSFCVIPLSIQPLAENAARHGVYYNSESGGTVTVRTYETAAAYVVEVEDDGQGFNVEEVLARDSDSVGLKNLIFRLKALMNADVVIDSKIGVGTKATVTIPKKEDK